MLYYRKLEKSLFCLAWQMALSTKIIGNVMFGFGNKKREFIAELSKELSAMANVSVLEVERFTAEYRKFVLSESFDRGLDSFTGAWNICDKLIERIGNPPIFNGVRS
jgi:hypothetical protein